MSWRTVRSALGAVASCALAAAGLPAAAAPEWLPVPEGVDAREVARRAEGNLRSDRTFFSARMTVESPRLARPRRLVLVPPASRLRLGAACHPERSEGSRPGPKCIRVNKYEKPGFLNSEATASSIKNRAPSFPPSLAEPALSLSKHALSSVEGGRGLG